MELKAYERVKFATNLRPLLIRNKCESCGETEKLELHHDKQFAEMLKETLDRLKYEYKLRKEDYSNEQLENITDMLLGVHIKSTYTTLCGKCHIEIHSSGELITNYLIVKNSEKEKELDFIKLKDIINNVINIKMYKDQQLEFKKRLNGLYNAPKANHRSVGLKTINTYFEEYNLNYIIYSKRDRKSKEFRDQTYWMIKEK